jgi:hypothetical protein
MALRTSPAFGQDGDRTYNGFRVADIVAGRLSAGQHGARPEPVTAHA